MTGFAPEIPKEDPLGVPFLECFFHTSLLWRFEGNRKVIVTSGVYFPTSCTSNRAQTVILDFLEVVGSRRLRRRSSDFYPWTTVSLLSARYRWPHQNFRLSFTLGHNCFQLPTTIT